MSPARIAAQRMLNQRIAGEKCAQPAEVVKWMGALQAQDYHQALWAVGVRMQSPTVDAVTQAIMDRKIVLTWPLRGTIHFAPAEDVKWMLELSATRRLAGNKRRTQQLELDEETLERCQVIFYGALQGGKQLSRPDMMQLLEQNGISAKGQRGYHILWTLAQQGLLCMGPRQAKQQTFVLLDEWVPHSRELSREASLVELARRYFASHGPATLQDFARWAGITLTDAKAGVHEAGSDLMAETVNGETCWQGAGSIDAESLDMSGGVLLPGFDEYLIGYGNRSDVLPDEYASQVVPGSNGIFLPVVVVDGQVVGTWKRVFRKKGVIITLNPFTKGNITEEKITAAAQSYSHFMGLPLVQINIDDE
ncbi:MAG: AlkZ family DNA glycosylase [Anaerolineaceae bacterium]|nr:AlkZ family DNA glycosylase [Anaerolineaceae bacterium]